MIEWTALTDRVFVTSVEPHGVNVGLIVGSESALLVDSGNSAEQGRELIESATAVADVPVTRVVVTHDHDDHSGGVAGMGGVASIAHENLTAFHPTRQFSMAVAVDLGDQRVEMIHFGAAHTSSDVIVFVPGENVIFVGDLLEESGDPQIDETTSLSNWPTALDGVLGASTDDTRFVPGHGAVVDREFAFRQRAEIAMLYSQTEMLIKQGTKVEDAASATEWPFTAETMAVALPKAYAELAAKGVEPKRQLPLLSL